MNYQIHWGWTSIFKMLYLNLQIMEIEFNLTNKLPMAIELKNPNDELVAFRL